MSFRVVLYAEGAGETFGESLETSMPEPAPGELIPAAQLGAAHVLMRRSISRARNVPDSAIQFAAPLRTGSGLRPTGSALHDAKVLRRLLVWPNASTRPQLAIEIVDEDGERDRRKSLATAIEALVQMPPTRILGIAVQEFEAWLVADHVAAGGVLGSTLDMTKDPESMVRREARELLDLWMQGIGEREDRRLKRREIAERCDLRALARRCPSFGRLLNDMGATRI